MNIILPPIYDNEAAHQQLKQLMEQKKNLSRQIGRYTLCMDKHIKYDKAKILAQYIFLDVDNQLSGNGKSR